MMKLIITLLSISLIISLSSCGSGDNSNNGIGGDDSLSNVDTTQKIEKRIVNTQKVFSNIPSPVITASILKESNAVYDQSLLNSYQRVSQYSTNAGKSLNIGVYGIDLSLCSIFNQTQTTMYYINVVKTLADELNLSSVFSSKMVQRLTNNVNNRDSVLKIIKDSYQQMNDFFRNDNSEKLAAFVSIGGWVEGLYTGTQMVKDTALKTKLTDQIAKQKHSINNLIKLLDTYKSNSLISHFQEELKDLQNTFNEINITRNGDGKPQYDMRTIMQIKQKVEKIRNEIIATS